MNVSDISENMFKPILPLVIPFSFLEYFIYRIKYYLIVLFLLYLEIRINARSDNFSDKFSERFNVKLETFETNKIVPLS